jgi:hypothetical protein
MTSSHPHKKRLCGEEKKKRTKNIKAWERILMDKFKDFFPVTGLLLHECVNGFVELS